MTSARKPGHHFDGRPRKVARGAELYLELKGDPRRRARALEAPAPAPHARPVTGLMTDGGTTFATWTDRELWNPRWALLIDELRRQQQLVHDGVLHAEDVPDVLLPLPDLPRPAQRGLAGVLEAGGPTRIDYRLYGFGGGYGLPVAKVGLKGRSIVLHFRDRAYVQLAERVHPRTGESGWYCTVQAKHKELYDRGVDEWLRTWLGYFSWLFRDVWAIPSGLRELGWTTTQWHLNADFVGLTFVSEDLVDATAVRKRTIYGRQDDFSDDLHGDDDDDDDDEPPPWLQTWQLGRSTSDVTIVGYKKGDQLREAKRLEPAASAYARHWRAHGWSPAEGDPFRVEIRARKKGLVYRRKDSDEILFDFRDPALLCDDRARRTFWAKVTGRRRLVTRTEARVRRCATDPRWLIVQSAARMDDPEDIRQLPHEIAKLTRAERVAKDSRKLFDALQDLALDRWGIGLESPRACAAALRHLADELENGVLPLDRLGQGILANPWRPHVALRRKLARVQFFLDELVVELAPARAALRRHGSGEVASIFDLLRLPEPQLPDEGKDDPP